MKKEGRILWRPGEHGFERRAVLVDESGATLHEGRIIPYTFSDNEDDADARNASARDVADWAATNGFTILPDRPRAEEGAASDTTDGGAPAPSQE